VWAIVASGDRGPFGEHCEYVQAGPPGPQGNKLVVGQERGEYWIVREGRDIEVRGLSGTRCEGPQATIHNIDQIVLEARGEPVLVDTREGPFAPGAGPERGQAEIEIRTDVKVLEYRASERGDRIVGRTLGNEDVAINVDPRADGAAPDFDIVNRGHPAVLKLIGGDGDDRIDARRVTGMDDPQLDRVVRLFGERGDDVILGSPGQDWGVRDGPGDDVVMAGRGDDSVFFGLGHDRIYGGPGNDDLIYSAWERFSGQPDDVSDRLYGGPGPDQIIDLNGHSDLIRCGRGFDDVERERIDRIAGDCEHLRF
jgi:hypothetical protein